MFVSTQLPKNNDESPSAVYRLMESKVDGATVEAPEGEKRVRRRTK